MPLHRSHKERFFDILKGALLFGLLGPTFGGLLFILFFTLLTAVDGFGNLEYSEWVAFNFVIIGLAYYIAALPAALTGALAGALRPRLSSKIIALAVGLFATLVTVLSLHINLFDSSAPFWRPNPSNSSLDTIAGIFGFVAALVCIKPFRPRKATTPASVDTRP